MADVIVVYRSLLDAIEPMSNEERGELLTAYLKYGFNREETEINSPMAKAIMAMAKPILDSNNAKRESGRKGGLSKSARVLEKNDVATLNDNNKGATQEMSSNKNKKQVQETSTRTRNIFIPPTLAEVTEYCKVRNNNIDPVAFIDYYQTRNWELGKGRKVKDWKAAVRTWEHNSFGKSYQDVAPQYEETDWERVFKGDAK